MKRAFFLILGIVVSVACFAWSLRGTDSEALKTGFQNANYWSLPIMLALLFGFYWLKTLRWQWLLAPVAPLTMKQLFPPMLIGFAANNLLPAHLGEFIRVFVVRKKYGVPASTVLSTVILERIFDVLAILALFSVGLAFTDDLPDKYRNGALVLGALAGAVVVAVVVYLIWTEPFIRLVTWSLSLLQFLPAKLSTGLVEMLRKGGDGLIALKSGKAVLLIVVTSLLQWLLNGLIAYVALRAFHIDVTPATGLIVTGVTAFGVTIPSTPGYFGVIQMCFQVSMNAQQVKPDPSLVLGASVYYQMSMYIPVTMLGLYFLHQLGLSLKDLQKAAEKPDKPAVPTDDDGSLERQAAEKILP
ncbi:MAG: flippase-like domain-containing protein [Fuerstia sp.]|nr:flippase-like domain-containing protein [Fuerstiella sp.]